MIQRPFWLQQIERLWRRVPIVWLSGVRRVGKTTLARQLDGARLVNCDLTVNARELENPEAFLRSVREPRLILDEVHQLPDPSRLLKISADEFPRLKVLATGSSTLAATRKFRDSLTGRKREVHLAPVLAEELEAFGIRDIPLRLLRGGLPQALLAADPDPGFFPEWVDSYYARDVVELFRVEKRDGFLRVLETLLRRSGGIFDASRTAKECALSRITVMNYLNALEVTGVIRILRPFHGGGAQELIRQPKIYGFDTGFVCAARGWDSLRPEDRGILWEHLVLDTLQSLADARTPGYWRDKAGREIDFVVPASRDRMHTVEAKWSADALEAKNLAEFRRLHPHGRNFAVVPEIPGTVTRDVAGLPVTFVALQDLRREINAPDPGPSGRRSA